MVPLRPVRWNNDKIITVFKNLGLVRKISIKTQYKYKSVKLSLNLKKGNDDWRSRAYISLLVEDRRYWFRWFQASLKLSEIKELYKFAAYKEIKEDLLKLSEEEIMNFYVEDGWFFGKTIFIKGKRYFYAYFQTRSLLEKAIEESIERDGVEAL
ncbi:unnamed protein product [Rhizophagus irregularis]|nr:unnamed protein product [Rhizophagus irregularis]